MVRDEIKEPGCLRRRQVGAGDPDLFLVTSVAGDLAAPLELAVAAGHHVHDLLPGVHPAAGAETGALPDLLRLVGGFGVHLTSPTHQPLEALLWVKIAVIGGGGGENQLPLLDLLCNLLGCPPAPDHAVSLPVMLYYVMFCLFCLCFVMWAHECVELLCVALFVTVH